MKTIMNIVVRKTCSLCNRRSYVFIGRQFGRYTKEVSQKPNVITRISTRHEETHLQKRGIIVRNCSQKAPNDGLQRHRNIGIMAHVDAGKTTTTERMLYYSGEITSKGEVHHGNTVTDYMEQERARGITIASAFVKLRWNDHIVNLVDTPGHIDFTAEVENALAVIDSAVLLLDASAGVEAQTSTVWTQIKNHKLPCLVYVNKMDRFDADLNMCLGSLRKKLQCEPLPLQLPVVQEKAFIGVVDLPSLDVILWNVSSKAKNFKRYKMTENDPLYKVSMDERNELVDKLSSIDDKLADDILEKGALELISESEIRRAVRAVTIGEKAVPVICGSSYKDVGVQPLLDAVLDYLPSPHETQLCPKAFSKGDLLMKSFKVMHDKQRGAITFLRVYTGVLSKGHRLYNASKDKTEQVGKILVPFADDFEEIATADTGMYVAATGLKDTHPGEILCTSGGALKRMKSLLKTRYGLAEDNVEWLLQLKSQKMHPVFFCSVEVSSQAYQQALEKALVELQREDQSLGVTYDYETGQTVLSGMGELHLEIIRDRLRSNYKLDVDVGKVQIMYKEKLVSSAESEYTLSNTIGSALYEIKIRMTLSPNGGENHKLLALDKSPESASNLAHVGPKQLVVIERGIKAALRRGPVLGYEVIHSMATLHWLECKKNVPEQLLTAAASHCITQALKEAKAVLMEPIMSVELSVPEDKAHMVLGDLNRRRGEIQNVEDKGESKVIHSEVPSKELLGYSSDLRTITSGTASLFMTFADYRPLSEQQVDEIKNYAFHYKKFG